MLTLSLPGIGPEISQSIKDIYTAAKVSRAEDDLA
jgi:hypothetical protein